MMNLRDNPNVKRATGFVKEFRDFILRGNVIDLAVGIVIGAAFTSFVTAFVKDIITPLIPAGPHGLSNLEVPIYFGSKLLIGDFINAVFSFVIVAAVIFVFVVKPVNALMARFFPKKVEPPATRDCPYCLSSVPIRATRCAYCTSQLPVAGEAASRM